MEKKLLLQLEEQLLGRERKKKLKREIDKSALREFYRAAESQNWAEFEILKSTYDVFPELAQYMDFVFNQHNPHQSYEESKLTKSILVNAFWKCKKAIAGNCTNKELLQCAWEMRSAIFEAKKKGLPNMEIILFNIGWLYAKLGLLGPALAAMRWCRSQVGELGQLLVLRRMGNAHVLAHLEKCRIIEARLRLSLMIINADYTHACQLLNTFRNAEIGLADYYNLGIYFKKNNEDRIAKIIFSQISNEYGSVPGRLILLAKANITEIYIRGCEYIKAIKSLFQMIEILEAQNEIENSFPCARNIKMGTKSELENQTPQAASFDKIPANHLSKWNHLLNSMEKSKQAFSLDTLSRSIMNSQGKYSTPKNLVGKFLSTEERQIWIQDVLTKIHQVQHMCEISSWSVKLSSKRLKTLEEKQLELDRLVKENAKDMEKNENVRLFETKQDSPEVQAEYDRQKNKKARLYFQSVVYSQPVSTKLANLAKTTRRILDLMKVTEKEPLQLLQSLIREISQHQKFERHVELVKAIEQLLLLPHLGAIEAHHYRHILAQALVKLKSNRKALEIYDQLLKDRPDEVKYLMEVGELNLQVGNVEKALESFTEAARKGEVEGYTKLAEVFYKGGFYMDAARYFEKKSSITNNRADELKLAHAYSKIPQFFYRAIDILKGMLETDPLNQVAVLVLATIHQKQANFSKAIELCNSFLEKNSISARVHHTLGHLYLNTGQPRQAYDFFIRALRIDPTNVASLVQLVRMTKGEMRATTANLLRKAISIEPSNTQLLRLLAEVYGFPVSPDVSKEKLTAKQLSQIGEVLFSNNVYNEAQLAYSMALKLQETIESHQRLAQLALLRMDPNTAEAHLTRCIKKGGKFYKNILSMMARVKFMQGLYFDAREFGKTALKIETDKDEILKIEELIGLCCEALEEMEGAKKYYQGLKDKDPRFKLRLAICEDRLGNYFESKENYQQILQRDPLNLVALNNLANIHLMEGMDDKYLSKMEKVLKHYPCSLQLRKHLINYYLAQNNLSAAKKHLMIALPQKSDDIELLNIEGLLTKFEDQEEDKEMPINFSSDFRKNNFSCILVPSRFNNAKLSQ